MFGSKWPISSFFINLKKKCAKEYYLSKTMFLNRNQYKKKKNADLFPKRKISIFFWNAKEDETDKQTETSYN